ncbi:hypothetical protein A3Q56_01081 [Intoshia linei]|uniref:REM-1 domain-containing protein n=1 Tax=Intoshia linei TaxID=1819745 RepID=A0A177BAF6_9BILA|nr:hypothetical protein A3Q56_01081 [Intoshia linei]
MFLLELLSNKKYSTSENSTVDSKNKVNVTILRRLQKHLRIELRVLEGARKIVDSVINNKEVALQAKQQINETRCKIQYIRSKILSLSENPSYIRDSIISNEISEDDGADLNKIFTKDELHLKEIQYYLSIEQAYVDGYIKALIVVRNRKNDHLKKNIEKLQNDLATSLQKLILYKETMIRKFPKSLQANGSDYDIENYPMRSPSCQSKRVSSVFKSVITENQITMTTNKPLAFNGILKLKLTGMCDILFGNVKSYRDLAIWKDYCNKPSKEKPFSSITKSIQRLTRKNELPKINDDVMINIKLDDKLIGSTGWYSFNNKDFEYSLEVIMEQARFLQFSVLWHESKTMYAIKNVSLESLMEKVSNRVMVNLDPSGTIQLEINILSSNVGKPKLQRQKIVREIKRPKYIKNDDIFAWRRIMARVNPKSPKISDRKSKGTTTTSGETQSSVSTPDIPMENQESIQYFKSSKMMLNTESTTPVVKSAIVEPIKSVKNYRKFFKISSKLTETSKEQH